MNQPKRSNQRLGVALLGCGTVGSGVLDILQNHPPRVSSCANGDLEVVGVAVRTLDRERAPVVPVDKLTTDAASLVARPDVHVVVEVMGGLEPARTLVLSALQAGKAVVTANKAIVARFGDELAAAAREGGGQLFYEAAAAGAIPVVKVVAESLRGNRIDSLMGIVNGTCNYILTQMTESGAAFDAALADAQALGYAEADPTSDVGGEDAAYKLALLARLGFGTDVSLESVSCEGIEDVTAEDVSRARSLGYVIKLLAVAQRQGDGLEARVHPTLVPKEHPLAAVNGAFNAVFIDGDSAGPLMLYGQGAGRGPTASAVAADIIDAARAIRSAQAAGPAPGFAEGLTVLPLEDTESRYYVSLKVVDEPGVLAAVAGALARHGVSVASCLQEGQGAAPVDLIFVTHTVRHGALIAALVDVASLDSVTRVASTMRVLK